MKKFFLPLFAAVIFCSCGNTTSKATSDCDSDSIASFEEEGCEGNMNYMHPDTQMNELFGIVKHAKTVSRMAKDFEGNPFDNDDYEDTKSDLYFSRDGEYDLKHDGFSWRMEDPQIKRDDQYRVATVTWNVPEFGTDVSNEYEYDKRGMVKKLKEGGIESVSETKFKYDDDTNLISAEEESAGEGYVYKITKTYKILAKDDQLNWTKRVIKVDVKSGPDDGSNTYPDSETYYELETREIEYYE